MSVHSLRVPAAVRKGFSGQTDCSRWLPAQASCMKRKDVCRYSAAHSARHHFVTYQFIIGWCCNGCCLAGTLVLGLSSSAQCSLLSCSRWALAFYFYYFKGALKTFASFRTVKPFRSLVLPLQSSVTILSSCSVDAASSTAGLLTLLQPRWAFVCDHPWPSNLVNFNTLAFWLNCTSCHSRRNYSLCHNSSTGRTHTCLIRSSFMLGCSQQKTSLT